MEQIINNPSFIPSICFFSGGIAVLLIQAIIRAVKNPDTCPTPTLLLEDMVMAKLKSRLWVGSAASFGDYAAELKMSLESLNGKLGKVD